MRWYWWVVIGYPTALALVLILVRVNKGEDARRIRELEQHHLTLWESEMENQ